MTESTPPIRPGVVTAPARTPGLAITSVVLGFLGLCTVGLTAIAGLVTGIVSLRRINRQGGKRSGRGVAIAGIWVSSAALLVGPVVAAMVAAPLFLGYSVARSSVQTARASQARRLVEQVGGLVLVAAKKSESRLPSDEDWVAEIGAGSGQSVDALVRWPGKRESGRIFAMNVHLKNQRIDLLEEPERTVLLFEVQDGSSYWGGPELLPPEPRDEGGGYLILFADGKAAQVSVEDIDTVIWEPGK